MSDSNDRGSSWSLVSVSEAPGSRGSSSHDAQSAEAFRATPASCGANRSRARRATSGVPAAAQSAGLERELAHPVEVEGLDRVRGVVRERALGCVERPPDVVAAPRPVRPARCRDAPGP